MENNLREQISYLCFGYACANQFEDKPLECLVYPGNNRQFSCWFEGLPYWVTEDMYPKYSSDPTEYDPEYLTVVVDCLWGLPAKSFLAKGHIWDYVGHYQVTPERECPYKDKENGMPDFEGACPYCEAAKDEDHGYVYVGDGMCEVIYKKVQGKVETDE